MKINDMCKTERPREKLLARGAEALGDGELLAILLRTGRPGESALELAQRLLGLVGGRLCGLYECSPAYLAALPGVGSSRAAALLAAFELGRRFLQESAGGSAPISTPQQIHAIMHPRLKGLTHEECWEVLLDRKARIMKIVKVTTGGSQSTVIDVPAIVKNALENGAGSIILVHNHPGSSPRPSRQDIKETAALRAACLSCSITLLDHIIIADHNYYSFSEEKIY